MTQTQSVPTPSQELAGTATAWDIAVEILKRAGVSTSSVELVKDIAQLDHASNGFTPESVSVQVITGAESAYACVKGNPFSLDVRLAAGHSPSTSLKDSANDNRMQVTRLLRQATRMIYAANRLTRDNALRVPSAPGT